MAVPILDGIKNPSSPESLIQTLKALKNEIVGHSQRKESWVRRAIITDLKRILDYHKTSSKQRQRDDKDKGAQHDSPRSAEEEARLQAITIIGSLAHGGPAFVTPLRVGQIYAPLLHVISPVESSPPMILAGLRCLNAIADAVALEEIDDSTESEEFLRLLYTEQSLTSLNQILNQESSSPIVQYQINLTTELIAKTSNSERRRKHLKISGIFNTLAVRLATFVVASRQAQHGFDQNVSIMPANLKAKLAPLLHAICAVIADSKLRASEFCCFAVWDEVFPHRNRDIYSWRVPAAAVPANTETESGLSAFSAHTGSTKQRNTSNHPSLNTTAASSKLSTHKPHNIGEVGSSEGFNARDEDDTPLVAWLIDVVKTRDGITRLMAIWFIGLLFRSQMISVKRQRSLSMLLIPVLVNMLDSESKTVDFEESFSPPLAKTTARLVKETAPKVLALFVQDNEFLQKGAAEGGAIRKLSQLLKQSFDPIPASLLTPMWSAHDAEEHTLDMDPNEASVPGRQGIQPIVHHTLQIRESFLIAISAMATLSDGNRQAIIDNGVVPFVIESLKPADPQQGRQSSQENVKPRNSVSTLVAACGAARTLSRSVAVLRTSLVDAGLAKPIYTLLKHPEPNVQIAATEALTNIVLPFSAMRKDITEAGVLHILCEHAHSSESKLRISALWALSNFVVEAENNLKIQVVRELSPGWLKHIICTGGGEDASSRRSQESLGFGMTTANSSGEHVNILNTVDDGSPEYQLHREAAADINMSDNFGSGSQFGQPAKHFLSTAGLATASDEYFDARADERTAAIQAARDDLAVQEQGLNLVRNLLVGGTDVSDIVDYLFAELGQDKLFDIFTNLLRPKNMDGFRGQDRRPGAQSSKLVPPPTEIVAGVCYILVHIAASGPRHKQIVLAQTELLRLIIPLFTHPHPGVRVALVWLVINISWKEDASDKEAAMNRALELERLGIIAKVHEAADDSDRDVRERAKQAIVTLTDLMRK